MVLALFAAAGLAIFTPTRRPALRLAVLAALVIALDILTMR